MPAGPDRLLDLLGGAAKAGVRTMLIRWADLWPSVEQSGNNRAYPETVIAAVDRQATAAGIQVVPVLETVVAAPRRFDHLRRAGRGGADRSLLPAVCNHLIERIDDIRSLMSGLQRIAVAEPTYGRTVALQATGPHAAVWVETVGRVEKETGVEIFLPEATRGMPPAGGIPPERFIRSADDHADELRVQWGYRSGWRGRLRTPVEYQAAALLADRRAAASVPDAFSRAWEAFDRWRGDAWAAAADAYALVCVPDGPEADAVGGLVSELRRIVADGRRLERELTVAADGLVEPCWIAVEVDREQDPLKELCSILSERGRRSRRRRRS